MKEVFEKHKTEYKISNLTDIEIKGDKILANKEEIGNYGTVDDDILFVLRSKKTGGKFKNYEHKRYPKKTTDL